MFRLSTTTLYRMYLHYFQLLGLCPNVFSYSTKFNLKMLMISLIHIVLLTLSVIIVYVYSCYIFFDGDIFGKFNDILKYIGAVVAYYAILIESFLKRQTQAKIWNLLAQCHHSDSLEAIDERKLWNPKEFNYCFFGYFALLIMTECYRMPFLFSTSQTINFWSIYMIVVLVSRSRHMQYIFYLNILHEQLNLLIEELKSIEEYSKYSRASWNSPAKYAYNRFLRHRLILARENYSMIFGISTNINEAFGWSHLANLTHSFVQILTDFYWLYWNTDNNANILFGDNVFSSIPSIVIVILVFGYTTELHTKAQKIGFFVHKINKIESGSRMRSLIESFSMQLWHEPIIFRAQGCFNLDFSVLTDMLAAITTYMVFFIQFTPRYKSSK